MTGIINLDNYMTYLFFLHIFPQKLFMFQLAVKSVSYCETIKSKHIAYKTEIIPHQLDVKDLNEDTQVWLFVVQST